MNREICDIIKYDSESSGLDFKKEHYQLGKYLKRNDILKDISSFANHPSNNPKYIFVGIKEKGGIANEFFDVDETIDEATFQKFVFDNIEPKINFDFRYLEYEGKKIGCFKIQGNNDRPYLFKKDVKNPINDKLEFRTGDGFIRIGTATKKIDRKDLDEIYKVKFLNQDRKDDITIKPYFKYSDNEYFAELELKCVDIEIINNSNKSIDLEAEIKVFKGDGFALISESDLEKELRKQKRKNSSSFMGIGFESIQTPNLHVTYTDEDDYVILERNSLARKSAISLAQHSSEKDVFYQYLFVLEEEPHEIFAEIILRSDDFTNGPLKKEIIFKSE